MLHDLAHALLRHAEDPLGSDILVQAESVEPIDQPDDPISPPEAHASAVPGRPGGEPRGRRHGGDESDRADQRAHDLGRNDLGAHEVPEGELRELEQDQQGEGCTGVREGERVDDGTDVVATHSHAGSEQLPRPEPRVRFSELPHRRSLSHSDIVDRAEGTDHDPRRQQTGEINIHADGGDDVGTFGAEADEVCKAASTGR
jgi:hypothetical protein